jgi:hypothetical protein
VISLNYATNTCRCGSRTIGYPSLTSGTTASTATCAGCSCKNKTGDVSQIRVPAHLTDLFIVTAA